MIQKIEEAKFKNEKSYLGHPVDGSNVGCLSRHNDNNAPFLIQGHCCFHLNKEDSGKTFLKQKQIHL